MSGVQAVGGKSGAQHDQFDHAGPQAIREGGARWQGSDHGPDVLFQTTAQGRADGEELRRVKVGEFGGQVGASQPGFPCQALLDAVPPPGAGLAPAGSAWGAPGWGPAGPTGDCTLGEGHLAATLQLDQKPAKALCQGRFLDLCDSLLNAFQCPRVQGDGFPRIRFLAGRGR